MQFFTGSDLMTDVEKQFCAAQNRISRRAYLPNALSDGVREGITAEAERINALFPEGKILLSFDRADSVFDMLGSLGAIKAPAAAGFLCDTGTPFYYEKCGYMGEAFVLSMTAMGIGTCWVTGTYSKSGAAEVFPCVDGQTVAAVSPLGFVEGMRPLGEQMLELLSGNRRRRGVESYLPGYATAPEWIRAAVDCVLLAPSGMNAQPWAFCYRDGGLYLKKTSGQLSCRYIDQGIAMFHAELGARRAGFPCRWETPDDPAFIAALKLA